MLRKQKIEKKKKNKKPVVGFYAITGCQGCLLSVLFNEDKLFDLTKLIDIKAFPFIKQLEGAKEFDVVFMEGLVAKKNDLKELKEIRAKTKVLVAIGACACTGGIPAFRNFMKEDNYKHLVYHKAMHLTDMKPTPIDKYVKVDYYLPGCPPDNNEILTFIKDFVLGKKPEIYKKPVCFDCRKEGNPCLLDSGKLCLGPITRGNCGAVCPSGGLECWGCRCPTDDANIKTMMSLLEKKGFDVSHIKKRMKSFVGLKLANKGIDTYEQAY